MIPWITEAEYIEGYRVLVTFKNGTTGEVDFKGDLDGPIFEPLKDPAYFRQFHIEGHTLAWENGADFAPEFVYDKLIASSATR
jgi:hypothetical protein